MQKLLIEKNMKSRLIYGAQLALLLVGACSEEKLKPQTNGDKAPAAVTNLRVENGAGKAKITYDVPNDPTLFYVKAEYENRPGHKMEAIATYYNNSIVLEGFNNTDEREVKLYSISRAEVRSEPITVKVKPLTAPIQSTLASLEPIADFGGISVKYENADTANIAIGVLTRGQREEPIQSDMYYTAEAVGEFASRGFNDTEQWFGLYVRDQWQNYSDTVWHRLKPLFEQQMDKKKFVGLKLPTDASTFGSTTLANLWNDVVSGGSSSTKTWYRSVNGAGIPHWITFDMGVTAKLSRFVEVPRGAFDEQNLLYAAGDPQLFEVWGTTQYNPDGSFNGWTKLMDCEVVKSSGLPITLNSNDDILRAQEGHQFKFPIDAPPVRYIRLKFLQTFGNSDYSWMAEITFFGQLQ
ncbi:protein of unknown function [bacterium A37T11]|nr:protein of unknown function [bacterium A37T11]